MHSNDVQDVGGGVSCWSESMAAKGPVQSTTEISTILTRIQFLVFMNAPPSPPPPTQYSRQIFKCITIEVVNQ